MLTVFQKQTLFFVSHAFLYANSYGESENDGIGLCKSQKSMVFFKKRILKNFVFAIFFLIFDFMLSSGDFWIPRVCLLGFQKRVVTGVEYPGGRG